jgi:hypothetical protein
MRFSNIVGLLAGLSSAVASPAPSKKDDNKTVVVEKVTYVYADCNVIKPKVFIISLVCIPYILVAMLIIL